MPETNLVRNPSFGSHADGWSFASPRAEIATGHAIGEGEGGARLILSSTGDAHAMGCWRGEAALVLGEWYRASVRASLRHIEHPRLSVFAQVARHFLIPAHREGDEVILEREFHHAGADDGCAFELYLRAAARGDASFREPRVERIPAPAGRMARLATVRFGEAGRSLSPEEQRGRIAEKLDLAGALHPDLVLLPEACEWIGVSWDLDRWIREAETVPDGPLCRLLSGRAARYGMHVVCGMVERDGVHAFNTAVVFDRGGGFVGRYRKTHPTFGEMSGGIAVGSEYPVFDLDFGRVAVHICYDEWFPEVARLYAHKGAEVLLLPVAGGKPITWRTRALDNGVHFVSASITPPSMVIESSGAIVAETHGDGIAFADLGLGNRRVNWYGDPSLSYGMPTVHPEMRNVSDDALLHELAALWEVTPIPEPPP